MVFALAGDSTTTTFMNPIYCARCVLQDDLNERVIKAKKGLTQGNEVAGMTLDLAGQFELEEEGGNHSR